MATKFLTHQEVFKIAKKLSGDKPTGIGSFHADYVSDPKIPTGPVPTIFIYEQTGYIPGLGIPVRELRRQFENKTGRGFVEVPVTTPTA